LFLLRDELHERKKKRKTNIEQRTTNEEGKNARVYDSEDRLTDIALPFEFHHSLFDIEYCCALVYEQQGCGQRRWIQMTTQPPQEPNNLGPENRRLCRWRFTAPCRAE
jgi:hypothetical protein